MPSASVRAKICGIRSVEAGLAAVRGGADYLGFVFYPPSRRSVTPATAAAIIRTLRQHDARVPMIGLFVNAEPATIAATVATAGLDGLQLSGHEMPAILATLAELRRPILKTIHLASDADRSLLLAMLDSYLAAATQLPAWEHGERLTFLLDAAVSGQFGGTGQPTDWPLAAYLTERRPCGLAGGLTAANVQAAIAHVQPWLVDVSGGVETDGAKDPAKIIDFLTSVQAVPDEPRGG